MPKTDKYRIIHILRYLLDNTDEEHPATVSDIKEHLEKIHIDAIPRTIREDIGALRDFGYDIICNRSTQNQYFVASRSFSTFELKLMIDAVQAAHFIPQSKTDEIVGRIASLASKDQADYLKRNLYVSKFKDNDKNTLIAADWLNTAINQNKKVSFQYYEYDHNVEKVLKYDGYRYAFSPYYLVWNMDNYYAVGMYERKSTPTITKFRIDKMCSLQIEEQERIPLPDDFNLAEFCDSMFLMYGEQRKNVTLRCAYSLMNKVVDRFGEDIIITPIDKDSFEITESVMTGSTLYSWIFNYCGKIRITAPEEVKAEFEAMLSSFSTIEDDIPF